MSPIILHTLMEIRRDMRVFPRAYTSRDPLTYFCRYYDFRRSVGRG